MLKNKILISVGIALFVLFAGTGAYLLVRKVPQSESSQVKGEIFVQSPQENQEISSPILIRGDAKSSWFFEGVFPIVLEDTSGKQIGFAQARALTDWTATSTVSFQAEMTFSGANGKGELVFKNDNPSGLPEKSVEYRVPVRMKRANIKADCRVTGCSKQLCSDSDMVTTCEYSPEYACYGKTVCQRQDDGACGWTQTPALQQCIADARKQKQGEKVY